MTSETAAGGILLGGRAAAVADSATEWLRTLGLADAVRLDWHGYNGSRCLQLSLRPEAVAAWLPAMDTTGLTTRLGLDTQQVQADLEKEILIALLASPVVLEFPSLDELLANVHMRRNIVVDGRKTELSFDTEGAERPAESWCYDEERGFTVRAGWPLADALKCATQPEISGKLYSFSCYRATEYVILLAIAEELAICNPLLLERLQRQCEQRVIRSGSFHDVFLHEYGSQAQPLPPRYYVPGDRVWFRNPDELSSDVTGFEGSWVFYLGDGLFTNFWKHHQPYALADKCLEIYHWRHGVYRNAAGLLAMDEAQVEKRVADSLQDAAEVARIMDKMMRWRDPKGVYGDGGCIDTTREAPRWICPGTADLMLPNLVH